MALASGDGEVEVDGNEWAKGLTHLDLSCTEIGPEGAWRLVDVLGECNALVHLDLSYNSLMSQRYDGAGMLAGLLEECKALTHLGLSAKSIFDDEAERLAGVLGGCTALAHLGLSNNHIGSVGVGTRRLLRECKARR